MKRLVICLVLIGCGDPQLMQSPGGGAGGSIGGGTGGATGGGAGGSIGGGTGGSTGGGSGGGATGGGSVGGGTGGATGGGTGGGATGGGSVGGGTGGATGGGAGGGTLDAGPCPHPFGAIDAIRKVVASHPYSMDGGIGQDNRYEVLELSATGVLSLTGQFFRMRRAFTPDALIAFTPDGTLGFVAQDDGTVGIFRFESNGAVTVVDAAYQAGFYASKVAVDSTGSYLYVIDFNTIANGGGVHRIALACDGTPTSLGKIFTGNAPAASAWLHGTPDRAVIAAGSLGSSTALESAHLVDFSSTTVVSSAAAFPMNDAIASHVAASFDDKRIAVVDNGLFAGNRIAILSLSGNTLAPLQLLSTSAPLGVAFSPFGTNGLVVNSDGLDQYRALVPDGGGYVISAPLFTGTARPQLPGPPIVLERGQLLGRVLIAELSSIRQLQFETDGGIRDVSKTPVTGTSNAASIGTFGVAP